MKRLNVPAHTAGIQRLADITPPLLERYIRKFRKEFSRWAKEGIFDSRCEHLVVLSDVMMGCGTPPPWSQTTIDMMYVDLVRITSLTARINTRLRYGKLSEMPMVHELLLGFTLLTSRTDINGFQRLSGINLYFSAYALCSVCMSSRALITHLHEVGDFTKIVHERCQILLDRRKDAGVGSFWMTTV